MHRIVSLVVFALACSTLSGCAHAVRIEAEPGTEIAVDGMPVGPAPAVYMAQPGLAPLSVTAKKGDKQNTVTVERNDIDWAMVGAASGAGALGCCAFSMVGMALLFVCPPAAIVGAGGMLPLIGGPVAGYFLGKTPPPMVRISADPAAAPAMGGVRGYGPSPGYGY